VIVGRCPGWQLRAFAGLRRPAAAIALADTILLGITDTEGARAEQLLAAAAEFRVHDDSVTARRLAEMAAGWYAAYPPRRPSSNRGRREGRAAYLTGRHELAVRLLERAARDTNDLDAAGYLALTHVSRGGRARARSMADSIGALRREWSFGRHTRWRAGKKPARDGLRVVRPRSHRHGQGHPRRRPGGAVNLNGRITRLERGRGGTACPECGMPPGAGPCGLRVEVPEVFDRLDRKAPKEPAPPPVRCGTCGRQLVYRIVIA
jgi:hypothetical protein